MKKEEIKKLFSDKELLEKQNQVIGLSNDLLRTFKQSEMFLKGRDNQELMLDTMMGIALFTIEILDAIAKSVDKSKEDILKVYYRLFPVMCEMKEELDEEGKIEEDKMYS